MLIFTQVIENDLESKSYSIIFLLGLSITLLSYQTKLSC